MGLEVLIPIFGILVVLVPITGLTAVLTAKHATRPIVEALAHLRIGDGPERGSPLHAQVAELTEQVEVLTREVRRLEEAQTFDRKLLEDRRA